MPAGNSSCEAHASNSVATRQRIAVERAGNGESPASALAPAGRLRRRRVRGDRHGGDPMRGASEEPRPAHGRGISGTDLRVHFDDMDGPCGCTCEYVAAEFHHGILETCGYLAGMSIERKFVMIMHEPLDGSLRRRCDG